jgi:hypothetical protein
MALPGLGRNSVTVYRQASTTDAEGNAVGTLTEHLATKGTYGSPSRRDREIAAQQGQQLDAVVAMEAADVRPGDVVEVMSQRWTVNGVVNVRTHQRVFLRRAS